MAIDVEVQDGIVIIVYDLKARLESGAVGISYRLVYELFDLPLSISTLGHEYVKGAVPPQSSLFFPRMTPDSIPPQISGA